MAENVYFAWIDESETFDPDVHNREDEDVFSFDFSQSEGDFAALSLVIKNPRIGLLNPGRKRWCYFSMNLGTGVECWFKGRLTGIPTNIFDTLVTLNFIAKSSNFETQKAALANSMKVLPYYDPIFISPDSWSDPDTVLEAYSMLWHIDPVTHVVTASNVALPEDGTVTVNEDVHLYDEMQVTLSQTPLTTVTMTATIPWTQSDEGGIDVTRAIKNAFDVDINGLITSYTMNGLIDNWPKQGDQIGSGWAVQNGSCTDFSFALPVEPIPDIFSWQGTVPRLAEGSFIYPLKVTGEYHAGEKAGFNFQFELVVVQKGYAAPFLSVQYTAGREMSQVVTFTMRTATQPIITDPGTDETKALSLNANKVSDVSEFGDIPLGNTKKRTYVHSQRGLLSIQYLLLVARAALIARSRAVETTFKLGIKDAASLRSLRKAALLNDHRLPGGQAVGKIIKYHYTLDGQDGAAVAEITIGSCVGYGGSYVGSPGTPTWVDEGWVDPGWQEYADTVTVLDTEDLQWTVANFTAFDDGLDFERGLDYKNAVINCHVIHPSGEQYAALSAASEGPNTDQAKVSSVLQEVPTQVSLQMVPMEGGPFQQEVVVSLSDLVIPKQIDLEAPSNA